MGCWANLLQPSGRKLLMLPSGKTNGTSYEDKNWRCNKTWDLCSSHST